MTASAEPGAVPQPGRRALAVPPLPRGFRVEPDPAARELEPGVWRAPGRLLRLTGPGRAAWLRLLRDGVTDRTTGRLARRLTDAGVVHPIPPPPARDPDVTVVVPVHDRAAALDRCLAALGDRYPVVVVDDASADELGTRAAAHRHGARLIRLATNAGPAAARNAGLAAVDTELVAFLDSDTVPAGDWIARLAPHFADPALAAVAPRVVPLRPVRHASALDLGTRRATVRPYGTVAYVPSAALLVRRATVDGFDAAMRTGEDVDLVWRLLEHGHRVRYEPGVQVPHEEPRGWARLARRVVYGRAAAPLAVRHPDSTAPLLVHPWYAAAVAALVARRPLLASGAIAGAVLTTRRDLAERGVPARANVPTVAQGVGRTWLAAGRCLAQFGSPAVLAARSPALAVTALAPSLAAWWPRRRDTGPVRFVAAHLAGEIAYGTGVLAGCVEHRTARPLRPRLVRRSS